MKGLFIYTANTGVIHLGTQRKNCYYNCPIVANENIFVCNEMDGMNLSLMIQYLP